MVAINIIQHLGGEGEETAVDEQVQVLGLFPEALHGVGALKLEHAEPFSRFDRGERGQLAVGLVELDQRLQIHVGNAVAVGHEEAFLPFQVFPNFLQPPAGRGFLAGVHQCHFPRFGKGLVPGDLVVPEIYGQIGHMEVVVGEVFLDDFPFVAQADDEFIESVAGITLHDVPKDGPAPDFYHGLGADIGLFTDPGSQSAGKDDNFHGVILSSLGI